MMLILPGASKRRGVRQLFLQHRLAVLAIVLSLTALTPCFQPLPVHAGQSNHTASTIKVGISSQVFPDLDHNDVRIAMSLWTREMARRIGVDCQPQPVIFSSANDLLLAVRKGELTLASLSALEYLRIRNKAPMTPLIVSSRNSGKGQRFVLIAHRGSGIRSIHDLNGKSIILPQAKNRASYLWLEVMLLKEGKRERNSFFRRVEEGKKSSQSIMAVFFKRADAAIVSRDAFETSKILNPQTGNQLAVIDESDYLLDGVTCIPHHVDASLRADIERVALTLHESTVGKQILTLFQMDRTALFNPSQLNGVERLVRERDRLLAQNGGKR